MLLSTMAVLYPFVQKSSQLVYVRSIIVKSDIFRITFLKPRTLFSEEIFIDYITTDSLLSLSISTFDLKSTTFTLKQELQSNYHIYSRRVYTIRSVVVEFSIETKLNWFSLFLQNKLTPSRLKWLIESHTKLHVQPSSSFISTFFSPNYQHFASVRSWEYA